MRNRHLILLLSILLAAFLVAGCGSTRSLTKGETDQFDAISGKIAQAEQMGAKECAPKELAIAKAELDGARHEATESWEDAPPYIGKADKAADTLLAKTKACLEAKKQPATKFVADPEAIYPGQCSTLKWSSENVKKSTLEGVGEVPPTGSKEVCPMETTEYQITSVGPGGTIYEFAKVSVNPKPAPPPPPPPPPEPVKEVAPAPAPAPPKVIEKTTLRVNFDTNKAVIRKADSAELQKAVDLVKKYPEAKVVVVGYTDDRGSDTYNQKLSEKRAQAVKKYLVDKGGVKADRITAEGKGEADPVGDNKTKKGQFENRRVEVLIMDK
jgi:OOP family OmpA-OmpF porin